MWPLKENITENKNSVNTVALALTAAGSALLTNSHQLHSKAGLPTGRGEDRPPVKKVGRDQGRLAEGVRPDQHQVNRVAHRKHGGRVRHFTTFSCKANVDTNYKLSTDNKLRKRIKTAHSHVPVPSPWISKRKPSFRSGSQEQGTGFERNLWLRKCRKSVNVEHTWPGKGSGSWRCSRKAFPPSTWRYRYRLDGSMLAEREWKQYCHFTVQTWCREWRRLVDLDLGEMSYFFPDG